MNILRELIDFPGGGSLEKPCRRSRDGNDIVWTGDSGRRDVNDNYVFENVRPKKGVLLYPTRVTGQSPLLPCLFRRAVSPLSPTDLRAGGG